jgi:hypothetical protein
MRQYLPPLLGVFLHNAQHMFRSVSRGKTALAPAGGHGYCLPPSQGVSQQHITALIGSLYSSIGKPRPAMKKLRLSPPLGAARRAVVERNTRSAAVGGWAPRPAPSMDLKLIRCAN